MERSALESLAGFLDRLSNPSFRAGNLVSPLINHDGEIEMPYVKFDEIVLNFISLAYDDKWLDTEFGWSKWAASPEAATLCDDPRALAIAGSREISRLLTVCIRQDRFVEGALLDAFNSGLILRIVRRAVALLSENPMPKNIDDALLVPTIGKQPSMKKLSNQQSGRLGEFLALAKLNSLGLAAYVSPEGAPGHDLIAIVDQQPKSIEVKTRQFFYKPTEITRWPVDLGTKGDADFFLFVEIDLRTISPTFYLLSNKQARATNKISSGHGNCYPSLVRAAVKTNDFSSLLIAPKEVSSLIKHL